MKLPLWHRILYFSNNAKVQYLVDILHDNVKLSSLADVYVYDNHYTFWSYITGRQEIRFDGDIIFENGEWLIEKDAAEIVSDIIRERYEKAYETEQERKAWLKEREKINKVEVSEAIRLSK